MGSFRRVPWRRSLEYQPMVAPGPPDPPMTDDPTSPQTALDVTSTPLSRERRQPVPRTGRDRIR
jgi:hypothetical protein